MTPILTLRVLFFVFVVLFLVKAVGAARRTRAQRARKVFRELELFFAGICCLFLGIFVYQATWHLSGFMRPDFVSFMQRYNRRPVSQAAGQARGRIFDRNGILLAAGDPKAPGKRQYPQQEDFAHLVGYSHSLYGQHGLEAVDNVSLSGAGLDPIRDFSRFGRGLLNHADIRGNDLQLTLDARLQHNAMALLGGRRGAVVGIRPSDGAVLVLASSPSFDPNVLSARDFDRPHSPLFNRALNGQYPPGSTFKMLTAAVAVEQGFNERLDCPAEGFVAARGSPPIRDHEYYEYKRRGRRWRGYRNMDLRDAFARSSNVFFAQIGVRAGAEKLRDMCRRCLLDRSLPVFSSPAGEIAARACHIPDMAAKADAAAAQVSIGQGALTVTPFHMALVTAALAHDGVAYAPHCRAGVPLRVLGRCVSSETARRVGALMRFSVQKGTSRGADLSGIHVAGKTGTAQTGRGADHSWFTCFAPYERPALALAVVVEHGGYGAEAALPIAVALLEQADELGLLTPAPGSAVP